MASGIVGKVPADLVHITPKAAWEDSFDKKLYHWADSKLFYDFKEFTHQILAEERKEIERNIIVNQNMIFIEHLRSDGSKIDMDAFTHGHIHGLNRAIAIIKDDLKS